MSDTLEFERFVRKPFVVESTVITAENIDAIAKLVGVDGVTKVKDGEKFIPLDRRVIPNMNRAYIGWHFTRMDENYRCYSPRIFEQQFLAVGEESEITLQLENGVSSES